MSREFPDLAIVTGKDHLLEDLGIRAGEVFAALQGHLVSAQREIPAIFLLLPAGGGEFAQVFVEAVPDPVIK